MVSDTPTDGRCNAETNGGYCEGWQMDNGRCHKHGGRNEDDERDAGGAPEGNTNSVSHGLYADENSFYQDVIDDNLRALCDEIFQDYATKYREMYGDVSTGHQARLFQIAVNQIKVIHSDNWLKNKPDGIKSGHPMVDKETKYTSEGQQYVEYSESVLIGTQQKLRREDRQWLKDMGLLHDPQSKQAEATQNLQELWADDLSN